MHFHDRFSKIKNQMSLSISLSAPIVSANTKLINSKQFLANQCTVVVNEPRARNVIRVTPICESCVSKHLQTTECIDCFDKRYSGYTNAVEAKQISVAERLIAFSAYNKIIKHQIIIDLSPTERDDIYTSYASRGIGARPVNVLPDDDEACDDNKTIAYPHDEAQQIPVVAVVPTQPQQEEKETIRGQIPVVVSQTTATTEQEQDEIIQDLCDFAKEDDERDMDMLRQSRLHRDAQQQQPQQEEKEDKKQTEEGERAREYHAHMLSFIHEFNQYFVRNPLRAPKLRKRIVNPKQNRQSLRIALKKLALPSRRDKTPQ